MKKTQLLLLFLWFTNFAVAQVSVIPKFGINISNVAFDDNTWAEREELIGFTGGVGLNYSLSDDGFLSIQPELLFSQKGFSAAGSAFGVNYDGTYRLNYLELPLLAKITFGGNAFKAYVNAGPSVAYLLSGRVKGRGNLLGIFGSNIDEAIQFTDDPNRLNITQLDANRIEAGVNFGGGIGYGFGNNSALFVDVRYNLGLTDFDKNQQSKNRVFAIAAGVQIPLSGR